MNRTCVLAALSLFLAASSLPVRAADPAAATVVPLPAPRTDGKVSVETALRERRSVRTYAPAPLTLEEVGQLCWAAQGVTDEKGHRTAPSARGTYPLELRVVAGDVTGLPPGVYRYQAAGHSLRLEAAGDRRAELDRKAVGQAWMPVAKAPAVFVLTGVTARAASGGDAAMNERGAHFVWVEAGLAAQGLFLEATALGLGSTYVGGFKAPEAQAVLGFPPSEELLAILPVGRKP
jgi:SagB-type dehydrogenase family enzyme